MNQIKADSGEVIRGVQAHKSKGLKSLSQMEKLLAANRGLSEIDGGPGTFIAFAAAPGHPAGEGYEKISIFTKAILSEIATNGLEIGEFMNRVRNSVIHGTKFQQTPWSSSSLTKPFYFSPISYSRAIALATWAFLAGILTAINTGICHDNNCSEALSEMMGYPQIIDTPLADLYEGLFSLTPFSSERFFNGGIFIPEQLPGLLLNGIIYAFIISKYLSNLVLLKYFGTAALFLLCPLIFVYMELYFSGFVDLANTLPPPDFNTYPGSKDFLLQTHNVIQRLLIGEGLFLIGAFGATAIMCVASQGNPAFRRPSIWTYVILAGAIGTLGAFMAGYGYSQLNEFGNFEKAPQRATAYALWPIWQFLVAGAMGYGLSTYVPDDNHTEGNRQ